MRTTRNNNVKEEVINNVPEDVYDTSVDFIVEEEVISEEEDIYYPDNYDEVMRLIDTYSKKLVEDEEEEAVEEEYEEEDEEDLDEEGVEQEKKKMSKGKKIALISSISIASILAVVGGIFLFVNSGKVHVRDVEESLVKLYTSSKREDIKNTVSISNIDRYYDKLEGVGDKEKTSDAYNSVKSELDTISVYVDDRDTITAMQTRSYDLNQQGTTETLAAIKGRTGDYTVAGLAITMVGKVDSISEDYDYYKALKAELQGISEFSTFDVALYRGKIEEVPYDVNKKELSSLCDSLDAQKKMLDAKSDADKKLAEEAKAKAEEAKAVAEEAQKKAQKELSSLKKSIEDNVKKVTKDKEGSKEVEDKVTETEEVAKPEQ